jgi:hypothetical protein
LDGPEVVVAVGEKSSVGLPAAIQAIGTVVSGARTVLTWTMALMRISLPRPITAPGNAEAPVAAEEDAGVGADRDVAADDGGGGDVGGVGDGGALALVLDQHRGILRALRRW